MSNEKNTINTGNVKKDLDIGKNALTLKNKTYPKSKVDYVCEVDSKTYDSTFPAWSILFALITILMVWMVYAAGFFNDGESAQVGVVLAFVLFMNAIVQIINWMINRKNASYNVELKLNSGEIYHFESDDEQAIKEKQRAAKKLVGY